jgi:hypothetical protein
MNTTLKTETAQIPEVSPSQKPSDDSAPQKPDERGAGEQDREHRDLVDQRHDGAERVQQIMIAAPTTHFVKLAQGIIFRGGALDVIWPQFLALALISAVLFGVALTRFRKTIGSM